MWVVVVNLPLESYVARKLLDCAAQYEDRLKTLVSVVMAMVPVLVVDGGDEVPLLSVDRSAPPSNGLLCERQKVKGMCFSVDTRSNVHRLLHVTARGSSSPRNPIARYSKCGTDHASEAKARKNDSLQNMMTIPPRNATGTSGVGIEALDADVCEVGRI